MDLSPVEFVTLNTQTTRQFMRTILTSNLIIAIAVCFASAVGATCFAAEWGTLKGRFTVDGTPPKPKPLVVAKDQFCIDKKLMDQSVVVGPKGELANAVVFLRLERGGKVEVHPDYAASLTEPVKLDNNGCLFQPHVALVRVGQPLVVTNSDPVGHNTKATLTQNAAFNVIVAQGQENKFTFTKPEAMPMPVNCNIHPWMEGHILVQDHPYMAVSADDGTFTVENVPAGKHQFVFWHESGYVRNAKVGPGKTDRRGRVELTIPAGGELDLGDIKVPASVLK
jgi:plastocyanin